VLFSTSRKRQEQITIKYKTCMCTSLQILQGATHVLLHEFLSLAAESVNDKHHTLATLAQGNGLRYSLNRRMNMLNCLPFYNYSIIIIIIIIMSLWNSPQKLGLLLDTFQQLQKTVILSTFALLRRFLTTSIQVYPTCCTLSWKQNDTSIS
jgi:hypothetical protein